MLNAGRREVRVTPSAHAPRVSLEAARAQIAALRHLNAFISTSNETGDGPVVAVKDLIDVRGLVTTAGGRQLPTAAATSDATVIEQLRKFGCVVIGKTNLHEFALGSTSENPHYGSVRNPHDDTRIAGGSSGGSAVAAATGMCEWSIGTDTAGSLRIPASLCGVASMRPSQREVSTQGVVPLSRSLDAVGPMAADVSTVAEALAMMTGREEFALARPAANPVLGVAPAWWVEGIDAETMTAWRRVSRGLQEVRLPDRESMSRVCTTIVLFEAAEYHDMWLKERPELYGTDVRKLLTEGTQIPRSEHTKAVAERLELLAAVEIAMHGFDALLVPATAVVAPHLGGPDVREPMTRFNRPFSATGQPVVTVPAKVAGLPVGIQVIGHENGDLRLLEVALALEAQWK